MVAADHELMEHVVTAGGRRRRGDNRGVAHCLSEHASHAPSAIVPAVQAAELDPQDGGVERVHARRRTDHLVVVADAFAV